MSGFENVVSQKENDGHNIQDIHLETMKQYVKLPCHS